MACLDSACGVFIAVYRSISYTPLIMISCNFISLLCTWVWCGSRKHHNFIHKKSNPDSWGQHHGKIQNLSQIHRVIYLATTIMQLPMLICAHQIVNYSITIIDTAVNQSNNSMNYTSYSYYYGPYFHIGGGTVHQCITSGLVRDKEYSLLVKFVELESQTIQSDEVLFSKLECLIMQH